MCASVVSSYAKDLKAWSNAFPTVLQQARGWGLLQGLVLRDDCDLNAAAVRERLLSIKNC
jgi:acetylornithine aminotransferase